MESNENSPPRSVASDDLCFSPPATLHTALNHKPSTPLLKLQADNNKRAKVTELARVFSVIGNIKESATGGPALTERAAAIRRRFSAMSAKMEVHVQPIGHAAPLRCVSQRGMLSTEASFRVREHHAYLLMMSVFADPRVIASLVCVPLLLFRCRPRYPRRHRRPT